MSKLIKKVFKAVKKVASGVGKFVKKHWKKIAVAALVVFTAGAASVVAAGGTWGSALTSVGSTFSAGASALTGGAIGTSAATAAGNAATAASLAAGEGAAMAGIQGGLATEAATAATASAGGVAGAINGATTSVGGLIGKAAGVSAPAGATAGTVAAAAPAAGMSVGKAMLIGTGVQAAGALYQGYEQKKAEEEAKKEQENASYYGMNGKGQYAGGFSADGVDPNLQPAYQNYQPQNPNAQLIAPRPTLLNRAAYQPIRTV